jgi:hypothetical protein
MKYIKLGRLQAIVTLFVVLSGGGVLEWVKYLRPPSSNPPVQAPHGTKVHKSTTTPSNTGSTQNTVTSNVWQQTIVPELPIIPEPAAPPISSTAPHLPTSTPLPNNIVQEVNFGGLSTLPYCDGKKDGAYLENITWWCTDDTNQITLVKGSGIQIISGTGNSELFSPLSPVNTADTYNVTITPASMSGSGLTCYIDEYDAYYKWLGGELFSFANCTSFGLTIDNVRYARVQIIVEGNSNTTAMLGGVKWTVAN